MDEDTDDESSSRKPSKSSKKGKGGSKGKKGKKGKFKIILFPSLIPRSHSHLTLLLDSLDCFSGPRLEIEYERETEPLTKEQLADW